MKASYSQEKLEIVKGDFELITGKFSPDDALDILSNLIQKKINYHNLRSFSHSERFGLNDVWSESRIEELRKCLESIQDIIVKAREQGVYLNIKSNISIEVLPS
ncbi:hypothetical protein SanaruYs_29900 [Chryseotalea sanaruensis]|uniref:Uncharacterized protein n=1 Tax=Chryseotalea sanaruensis TaxID=2482724 RepID=A0A401UD24_9BACT|nr:hypothetical protein [Chryseotalea sanaruensis]GCC52752.1 hypothetical protein SanaruYs_29900 [Chryseotalea sanaruensis]